MIQTKTNGNIKITLGNCIIQTSWIRFQFNESNRHFSVVIVNYLGITDGRNHCKTPETRSDASTKLLLTSKKSLNLKKLMLVTSL